MRIALMLTGLVLLMVGCYHTDDDDLRAVPVTNNPNITPQRELGPMQAMPY